MISNANVVMNKGVLDEAICNMANRAGGEDEVSLVANVINTRRRSMASR